MLQLRKFYKKSVLFTWFTFFSLLLILYTIGTGILFNYSKNAVTKNMQDTASYTLNRVRNDFEDFANSSDMIYSSLINDGTFNNYQSLPTNGYELYTLQKKLAPFSADNTNYMLWFENSDVLVSPNASLPSDVFYGTYFTEQFDSFDEFSEKVLHSDDRIFSAQRSDNGSYDGNSMIFYAKPLFSPTKKSTVKFIAYTNSDDLLYGSRDILEDNDFALVFRNKDRIFFANSDIDGFDPYAVGKGNGGKLKFNRTDYIATSNRNGAYEYTYIISNSAYSRPLRKIYMSSSVILSLFFILTVASIYWFVRRNYKPIRNLLNLLEIQFNYSVNEFDELNKKFSFYKEMQMKTTEELNLKRKISQHYIMLNIIDNKYVSGDDTLFLFDGAQPYKYNFIAVIGTGANENMNNMLNNILPDMLCEASENTESIIRSVVSGNNLCVLINSPSDNSHSFDSMFESVCRLSELTYNVKLHIGIGGICDEIFNVNESYNQACRALKHSKSSDKNIFHWEDVPRTATAAYYYPPELEQQLLKNLSASDYARVQSIFDKIYTVNFKERQLSPLIENLLFSNIIGTFNKFIDISPLTSSIHQVNPENFALNLSKCETTQEKQELIESILQIYRNTLNSEKQDKDSSIIKSVKKYINQNYSNPDVNVSTTAMYFGVRQDYLSRLFKQHEGINLLKYLNVVRLNRAAKMLETSTKNIADIASEVGFYNYRTFTRQFISHFNTTAQQYRDDHRKN